MIVKALILMAGEGQRFGSPKQFHLLADKPLYKHTLERFVASRLFDEIILVAPEGWMHDNGDARVIAGGRSRQESSYLGLLACAPCDYVVIHDGVRPFVSQRILEENIAGAKKYGAVDTCIPSADTLVHAPGGKRIESIPPRADYLRGQTPQSFAYPLILEAHRKCSVTSATDDCSLVLAMGKEVHIVRGEETNIKITTSFDLKLANSLLHG